MRLPCSYIWDNVSSTWIYKNKEMYYYSVESETNTNVFSNLTNNSCIIANPVKDEISIPFSDENAIFELYNLQGQKILSDKTNKSINVKNIVPGLYKYVISSEKYYCSGSIVIK